MKIQKQGITALITGANSGIGFELTKRLLGEGADVIALVRSNFNEADEQIKKALIEKHLRVYQADFQNFEALKSTLRQIQMNELKIDVLFNNAGVAISDIRHSSRGHEFHFEVNTVLPYIILMEMTDLLRKGNMKTVVNISSNALLYIKKFEMEILEHPVESKPIIGPYGMSKLALTLWTKEIAPQLAQEGIEIRSVNPGPTRTKMTSGPSALPRIVWLIRELFIQTPVIGANKICDTAWGKWQGKTGIFVNNGKETNFKYQEFGPIILRRVSEIYQKEYIAISSLPT